MLYYGFLKLISQLFPVNQHRYTTTNLYNYARPKKIQVKDTLFQALVDASEGTLTLEYLNETLSNSSISKEYCGTSSSDSAPRRVSAFRMFQKHFRDTPKDEKPKWDDFKKSNPDMVEQFEIEAAEVNKANNLDPDAIKSQKKLKKQQTK